MTSCITGHRIGQQGEQIWFPAITLKGVRSSKTIHLELKVMSRCLQEPLFCLRRQVNLSVLSDLMRPLPPPPLQSHVHLQEQEPNHSVIGYFLQSRHPSLLPQYPCQMELKPRKVGRLILSQMVRKTKTVMNYFPLLISSCVLSIEMLINISAFTFSFWKIDSETRMDWSDDPNIILAQFTREKERNTFQLQNKERRTDPIHSGSNDHSGKAVLEIQVPCPFRTETDCKTDSIIGATSKNLVPEPSRKVA